MSIRELGAHGQMKRDFDKKRYQAYDPFARIYNRHWGKSAMDIYPILDRLVLSDLPSGCAVLDLCCGTGQLAAVLSDKGYAATGVDGSEGMIEIARRNTPDVSFLVQDARELSLDRRFSAVFSTNDSLNHVMNLDELERVFRNVHTVLEDGGCFEFDLNMEQAFLTKWRNSFTYVEKDHMCIVRLSRDQKQRVGNAGLTLFELRSTGWERTDVSLPQRWYGDTDICERLRRAGFREFRTFDGNDAIMEKDQDHTGRMFFVAIKPEMNTADDTPELATRREYA